MGATSIILQTDGNIAGIRYVCIVSLVIFLKVFVNNNNLFIDSVLFLI